MSDTVGFAFLFGLLLGFIVGSAFIMSAVLRSEKKRIQNGVMENDGVVYRITRVDP